MDDMALLREYATGNSEAAFEALVSRRVGFVYSMALRQVRDPYLAEEVTQAVFIILAQKAGRISGKTILAGWLFRTTRFAALAQMRADAKRRRREQEANMQSELQPTAPDAFWEQMSPLLDEALATLGETDRQAVLLRFFENRSLAEVGSHLGTGEDTARKRVSRALEKLHRYFSKRGVSSTTAIIAGTISAHSVQAAPAMLAKSVTAVALAKGAAAGGSTLTLIKGALKIMAWTKAKIAVVVAAGVVLTAGTTTVVVKAVHLAQEKAQESRAADLFKTFVAGKRAQVVAAAAAEGKQMQPEYDAFFAAAEKGNVSVMERIVESLEKRPPLTEPSWEAMIETYCAFALFSMWDEKYAMAYSHDILESIPPGSIYLTGLSMGGSLIPALQKSEVNGDPCFTIALYEFPQESYRTYLQGMYGDKIYVPSKADVEKCFQEYAPDALLRNQQDKLEKHDLQQIDKLIAKVIFDKNPDREFYYDAVGPIDWMYPYLEPHGLILKINHQPLSELSDDTVTKDHDFWVKQLQPMIGDWLTYDTPVQELVAWTERVRLKHDFDGFKGDRHFIEDTRGEQKVYSRLRTVIGAVYAWRADHATDPAEKERMTREADFAFRQAFALWPTLPSTRYVDLLKKEDRQSDAQLIEEMARGTAPPIISRITRKPVPGAPAGWSVIRGESDQWNVTNGVIHGHSIGGDSLLVSSKKYHNVTLSAIAGTTNREASLAIRYQDADNGYLVLFCPDGIPNWSGRLLFYKIIAGNETVIASYHGRVFSTMGQSAKITVAVQGPSFEIRLNDVTVLRVKDTTFDSGFIGLRIYGDPNSPCDATFSNLTFH